MQKANLSSKKLSAHLAVLAALGVWAAVQPNMARADNMTYFVDPVSGNDTYTGTSSGTAWKTLSKVSGKTFLPGDKILFKRGGYWTGQLQPKGSGVNGNPIIIDAYGTGAAPIIDGNGLTDYKGVVELRNQEHWTIQNLDITNKYGTKTKSYGIYVYYDVLNGTMDGIYIKNNHIHHITNDDSNTDAGSADKYMGAIYMYSPRIDASNVVIQAKWNDIRIENNTIQYAGRSGITTNNRSARTTARTGGDTYATSNLLVRNNTVSYSAGDGMMIGSARDSLIEYNVVHHSGYTQPNANPTAYNVSIWPSWGSWRNTFQFNEVYAQYPNPDATAFDIDGYTYDTVHQYNYSHDNANGFLSTFLNGNWNNPFRYNISLNEPVFGPNNQYEAVSLYNNTFYNFKKTLNFSNIKAKTLYNNIFVNLGGSISIDPNWTVTRSNNLYYTNGGSVPTESTGVFAAPQFAGSLTDSPIGIHRVQAVKLSSTSPAINKGVSIADNGGRDYYGNALYNGLPDIGAHEYSGDAPEIIIDNKDAEFSTAGTWSSSTSRPGAFLVNYAHDGSSGADTGKTARWTPNIPAAASYNIYMRWPASSTSATAAPITVQSAYGTDTSKTVNQTLNDNAWVLIGTYQLSAGTGNYVQISAANAGWTIADAVKFVKN